jgi:hypothetical protein
MPGQGVAMPPRATLEPDDLVTPAKAASLLDVPVGTVYSWIHRYGIEPVGQLGRWNAYDYNAIAAVDARLRREREHAAPADLAA